MSRSNNGDQQKTTKKRAAELARQEAQRIADEEMWKKHDELYEEQKKQKAAEKRAAELDRLLKTQQKAAGGMATSGHRPKRRRRQATAQNAQMDHIPPTEPSHLLRLDNVAGGMAASAIERVANETTLNASSNLINNSTTTPFTLPSQSIDGFGFSAQPSTEARDLGSHAIGYSGNASSNPHPSNPSNAPEKNQQKNSRGNGRNKFLDEKKKELSNLMKNDDQATKIGEMLDKIPSLMHLNYRIDDASETLLHRAIGGKKYNIAKLLIDKGIYVTTPDMTGNTALDIAEYEIKKYSTNLENLQKLGEIKKLILQKLKTQGSIIENIELFREIGGTLRGRIKFNNLVRYSRINDLEGMKEILESTSSLGLNPTKFTAPCSYNLIHIVAARGQYQIIELLIEQYSNSNVKNKDRNEVITSFEHETDDGYNALGLINYALRLRLSNPGPNREKINNLEETKRLIEGYIRNHGSTPKIALGSEPPQFRPIPVILTKKERERITGDSTMEEVVGGAPSTDQRGDAGEMFEGNTEDSVANTLEFLDQVVNQMNEPLFTDQGNDAVEIFEGDAGEMFEGNTEDSVADTMELLDPANPMGWALSTDQRGDAGEMFEGNTEDSVADTMELLDPESQRVDENIHFRPLAEGVHNNESATGQSNTMNGLGYLPEVETGDYFDPANPMNEPSSTDQRGDAVESFDVDCFGAEFLADNSMIVGEYLAQIPSAWPTQPSRSNTPSESRAIGRLTPTGRGGRW